MTSITNAIMEIIKSMLKTNFPFNEINEKTMSDFLSTKRSSKNKKIVISLLQNNTPILKSTIEQWKDSRQKSIDKELACTEIRELTKTILIKNKGKLMRSHDIDREIKELGSEEIYNYGLVTVRGWVYGVISELRTEMRENNYLEYIISNQYTTLSKGKDGWMYTDDPEIIEEHLRKQADDNLKKSEKMQEHLENFLKHHSR